MFVLFVCVYPHVHVCMCVRSENASVKCIQSCGYSTLLNLKPCGTNVLVCVCTVRDSPDEDELLVERIEKLTAPDISKESECVCANQGCGPTLLHTSYIPYYITRSLVTFHTGQYMNLLPPTKAKNFVNTVLKMRQGNTFSVEYHVSCPYPIFCYH